MKTQEEIDEVYKKLYLSLDDSPHYHTWVKGYTQCQEDMTDKKYTEEDLITAVNQTINACNEAQKESYGDLEIDVDKIINSLNKQD